MNNQGGDVREGGNGDGNRGGDEGGGGKEGNVGTTANSNLGSFFTKPCGRDCLTCTRIGNSQKISSTNTNIKYKAISHDEPFCDCNSTNLIYVLKCNDCSYQYVGQTGRKLKERVGEHLRYIRRGYGGCPFLTKHFNHPQLCQNGFSVNVLEKCPGNGLTERKVVDKDKVSFRKSREKYWSWHLLKKHI